MPSLAERINSKIDVLYPSISKRFWNLLNVLPKTSYDVEAVLADLISGAIDEDSAYPFLVRIAQNKSLYAK